MTPPTRSAGGVSSPPHDRPPHPIRLRTPSSPSNPQARRRRHPLVVVRRPLHGLRRQAEMAQVTGDHKYIDYLNT